MSKITQRPYCVYSVFIHSLFDHSVNEQKNKTNSTLGGRGHSNLTGLLEFQLNKYAKR